MTNVAALRRRLGLSQPAFAAAYGIPLGTIRAWEQGRREPGPIAQALLTAIERDPDAMFELLNPGDQS